MTDRGHYLYQTMPEDLFKTLAILSKYAEIKTEWPQPDSFRPGLYIDPGRPTVRIWMSVNTSDISPTDLELLEALGVDTNSKVIYLDVKKETLKHNNMIPKKFRAWTGKEMVEVTDLTIFSDGSIKVNDDIDSHYDKWPVMQFTGMKDILNNEIFEGDILNWVSSNPFSLGERRWAEVKYVQARFWCQGSIGVYLAELLANEKCVVISNVYEPQLK